MNDLPSANKSDADNPDMLTDLESENEVLEDKKDDEEEEKERLADEAEDKKDNEADGFLVLKDGIKTTTPPTNGCYEFCYEGGKTVVNYKDGKKNGESLTYGENGELIMRVNFVNDRLEGPATQYYADGNIETILHYKNNEKTGPMTGYSQNNVKRFDANLLKDQLEGMFIFYDEYGDQSQICYYKNGLLEGVSTTFFPKNQGGQICRICHYEKGLLVKEDQFFYPDGKPLQTTTYDHKGRPLVYPTNFKPSGEVV
jgi:antitoxin component YwqK of YwqJK toxin-antitoxin module